MKHNVRNLVAISALAAVSLGGVAACSSSDDSSTKTTDKAATDNGSTDKGSGSSDAVKVEMKEYEFIPPAVEGTSSGGKVSFEVKNAGTLEHDFTVEGYEDEKIAVNKPGDTLTGSVSLEAGDYVIFCSVPGHRELGMEGTLTVK